MLSVEASYAHARDVTRAQARNFYFTFWFLPPERRRSIFAVYAFSRRADDAVDAVEETGASPEEARSRLERLRELLDVGSPAGADDPLAPALRDTIARFSIPRQPFEELLAGMEMDLTRKSYATFEDLKLYCYRAASVVGLICIEIFGYTDPRAHGPAVDLGIAMQLVNVLRDVAEDFGRGRVYLPEEDLRRFGYTRADLERGIADERFRGLMRLGVERARACFRQAEALHPLILPESRYCPLLLQRFYTRLLDRIELQGYDVLGRRPSLPLHEKLAIAGKAWLERAFTGP